jgi:hypothetical protein
MKYFNTLCVAVFIIIVFHGLVLGQPDTTLTITSNGEVGIGTTSPIDKLEVEGGPVTIDGAAGVSGLRFRQEDTMMWTFFTAPWLNTNDFRLRNENTGVDVMTFDYETNYVGIGLTNPVTKLDVSDIVRIQGATWPGTGKGLELAYRPTNHMGIIQVYDRDQSKWGNLYLGNGNVGIGTENPTIKMHVKDSALGNFVTNIENTSTTNSLGLAVETNSSDNSSAFRIMSAGSINFYVLNTGDVGIGTTSPKGKLDVNGSIYQRGISLHADYVFQPGYQLESIKEHSEFMWKYKHLKAIPKAQVDKNGQEIVEVGSHRKGIVEELEKAHIYIEQLHKRIKKLEVMIEKLAVENNYIK